VVLLLTASQIGAATPVRRPDAVPLFLNKALGTPQALASLTRHPARAVKVTIDRTGFNVIHKNASVSLAARNVGGQGWKRFARGVSRSTPFGRETVLVERTKAEEFLSVDRHYGARTWRWRLQASGLTPTLRRDGSVGFLTGGAFSGLSIPAVAVLDARGRDVTPHGLQWSLRRLGSSWRLGLRLDDTKLPLPYVIDPAIVFKAASAAGSMGATTLVIPKPTGVVADDFLIAGVTVRDNPTITPPSGWTFLRRDPVSPTTVTQAIYYKVAGASEPASYTWTFSSSQKASGGIIAYTGVDNSNPIDVHSGNSGSGMMLTALSVTTTAPDDMIVGFFGIARSTGITAPSGMTERFQVQAGGGAADTKTTSEGSDVTQSTIGATGNKTATASQGADWVAQLVALRAKRQRATSTGVSCGALTVGVAATCTATVSDTDSGTKTTPTGTVTFSSDDSSGVFVGSPCVLVTTDPFDPGAPSSCQVSYTPGTAGTTTIRGDYSGDATHGTSFGTTTLTVAKRSTSTGVSCGALTVGIGATCTATVTDTASGTATTPIGAVSFSSTKSGSFVPNPCTLAPTPDPSDGPTASCATTYTPSEAGSATITAHYNGDLIHLESEGTTTVTIAKRSTSTSVSCTPGSFQAGGSTSCTATVTDTASGTATTPTGTVDFSSNQIGTFTPPSCTLTPTPDPTDGPTAGCTAPVLYSSTVAATHTITGAYSGDLIHQTSSGSTTVSVTPGPPAIVTVDPVTDTNEVNTQHCVTATVTDQYGNPTGGVRVFFSVTGSNRASGSSTTDSSGKAGFCYVGRLFGVDTITAVADRNGNGNPDPGEPTGTATKIWTLPPSTAFCFIDFATYGIRIIAANGDLGSGGGNVQVDADGNPTGQHQYQDHGPVEPMTVHSINVLAAVCSDIPDVPGGKQAQIYGRATIDGSGSYIYRIDVEDRGEPGTGNDKYWIALSTGYNSGNQTLVGGNVQIH
jgi:Bacterial Ig-like domain (group 1)